MEETTTDPRPHRLRALGIAAVASFLVFLFWNISALNFIVYPLKLFVTFVHEAGHCAAAILTGGAVRSFHVSADMSGLATTAGGVRAVILPAGYLGAALFGSALFYVVNRFPRSIRGFSFALGLATLLFTLLFARPDESGNPMAILVGVAFGGLLLFAAIRLKPWINLLLLNILAISTGLDAVMDIWRLLGSIGASRGAVHNDAAAFQREVIPFLPASVIAFIWCLLAAGMFAAACYWGVWKSLIGEADAAVKSPEERP